MNVTDEREIIKSLFMELITRFNKQILESGITLDQSTYSLVNRIINCIDYGSGAHGKIAALSEWIDSTYPPDVVVGTELHLRRRTDKIIEEAGEVGSAVSGVFGENQRKGVTHTIADVLDELLDVAITALAAYESLSGNSGLSGPALDHKVDRVLDRVGTGRNAK